MQGLRDRRPSPRDPVIVGVGESAAVGEVPGKSSLMLHAEAASAAIADSGLSKEDVDGVLTNDSYLDYHVRHAMAFAEYCGITPSTAPTTKTEPNSCPFAPCSELTWTAS